MKKAQGLSINTIIITILALLVLVVIAIIFTGRVGIFGRGVSTCPGRCDVTCNTNIGDSSLLGTYADPSDTSKKCGKTISGNPLMINGKEGEYIENPATKQRTAKDAARFCCSLSS
ncbi:hypothetical protein HY642_00895 [Candidatus Woesearchaeota archaeon]|nr:hypothetical protein [Candidatus Woesearchaeota archaeon]